MKFYECSHCHNIIAYVKSSGVPVICCGEPMKELIPNTTDAAGEKHVPVIQVEGNKVTVTVGCWTPTTSCGSRWKPSRGISARSCTRARSPAQNL